MNKDREQSARGKVIGEMLEHFTHDLSIGKMVQTGELRKRLHEPPYICPPGFNMTHFDRENYSMELMTRTSNPKLNGMVLQLHGGGYIGAVRNKYYNFAKMYVNMTDGFPVLTPDYRVAPEHVFPCALQDAYDAYEWILSRGIEPKNIILAGDSAGGGLCMALCMYLRDQGMEMPRAIIAMSPWTDLSASGESYTTKYEVDPLFGNTKNSMIYNNPYIGEDDVKNPYISPLYGDFTNFPEMLIQVGSMEMLLSDSISVANKINAKGGFVKLSVYEGMFHVFQMCFSMIPESKNAWDEVEDFIKNLNV